MRILEVIAGCASVLGLLVSVWVLLDVRKIKQYYAGKIRKPELLNRLKASLSVLVSEETILDDFNKLSLELFRIKASLKSLAKYISKPIKKEIDEFLPILEVICQNIKKVKKDDINRVYVSGNAILLNIESDEEDKNIMH